MTKYVIKTNEDSRWYVVYKNDEELYSISKCNPLDKIINFYTKQGVEIEVISKED